MDRFFFVGKAVHLLHFRWQAAHFGFNDYEQFFKQ